MSFRYKNDKVSSEIRMSMDAIQKIILLYTINSSALVSPFSSEKVCFLEQSQSQEQSNSFSHNPLLFLEVRQITKIQSTASPIVPSLVCI